MHLKVLLVIVVLLGLGCGDDAAGDDAGAGPGSGSGAGHTGGGSNATAGGKGANAGDGATDGGGGERSGGSGAGRGGSGAGGRNGAGGETGDGGGGGDSGGGGPPVVEGWTDFQMQPGTHVIYVSNSGDDGAPGTIDEPKATIDGAYAAVRDGEPDWVLFKRGDEWTRTSEFAWFKSGPSADDAGFMRLGAYGDESLPRPRIDSGMGGGLVLSPGYQATRPLTHVAVTDLYFIAAARIAAATTAGPALGIQTVAVEYMGSGDPLRGIVIENVKLEGFGFGFSAGGDVRDLRIRRCIFTDIFSPGGDGTNGSAILTSAADVLIEDNVFYRIQHPDNPAVTAISTMAHAAYLGAEGRNVVARGNIIIKATEGFMQRAGGVFERNVAVSTQIAHLSGQAWGVTPTADGVTATIQDNLFLNATSSLILGNTATGSVLRNLIVRGPEGTASVGIDLIAQNASGSGQNIGVHATTFEDNVLSGGLSYDPGDTASFSGLTFTDNRTDVGPIATSIADFVSSVGLDGDIDDYAADLIARDRANFSARHLSTAMLDFYRDAEGLPALQ